MPRRRVHWPWRGALRPADAARAVFSCQPARVPGVAFRNARDLRAGLGDGRIIVIPCVIEYHGTPYLSSHQMPW